MFLYYLGTEGSSASNPNLHNVYWIGHGTSELYKKCVVTAIINCMNEMYYKWLSADDRKQIMCQFHFPTHLECMDGTLNPLTFEQQYQDTSDYSGWKYLSTLVVNDDKQRITYYLAGWTGST